MVLGPTIVSRTPLSDALGAVGVSPSSMPAAVAWSLASAVRVRLVFLAVYGPSRGAEEWRAVHLPACRAVAQSCRNVAALVDGSERRAHWSYVLTFAAIQGAQEAARVRGGGL